MRVVIQRVKGASVTIDGNIYSSIAEGILLLVGFEDEDGADDLDWASSKIVNLRIFNDENGIMNKSILDVGGEFLVVSQFTLHAATKKGNRPSYIKAARPEVAIPIYEEFLKVLGQKHGKEIKTGEFGADMQVSLVNDGPVTILIDTKNKE